MARRPVIVMTASFAWWITIFLSLLTVGFDYLDILPAASLGRPALAQRLGLSTATSAAPVAAAAAAAPVVQSVVAPCRCAVLYSGHVRSFVQPRVHMSHKTNLIEPLETECDVDVFMYLSVEDEVPMRNTSGVNKLSDTLAFAAYTPGRTAVDDAIQRFNPVTVAYHQEQAGFIPNRCETGAWCLPNAYWQLYKMKAVYGMMEEHETNTGKLYTWVVRSRLDIGWLYPLPPLTRFPATRVYAGHNFFPLGDQFLLVPRRFAHATFGAVRFCYSCEVMARQSKSGVPAQAEHLLRLAIQRAEIPFAYYEFPVVIVRHKEGGLCSVLHPHKITCELLQGSGLIGDREGRKEVGDEGDDGGHDQRCISTVYGWYRRACREMFPPFHVGDNAYGDFDFVRGDSVHVLPSSLKPKRVESVDGGGGDDAVGVKKRAFAADTAGFADHSSLISIGDTSRGGGNDEVIHDRGEDNVQVVDGVVGRDWGPSASGAGGGGGERHRDIPGSAATATEEEEVSSRQARPPEKRSTTGSSAATFEEATGRLSRVRRTLRELSSSIRIHPSPQRTRWDFYIAHHYPFHQVNDGALDEISVLGGFRLSEEDFNRAAIAFACYLDGVGRQEEGEKDEEDEDEDEEEEGDLASVENRDNTLHAMRSVEARGLPVGDYRAQEAWGRDDQPNLGNEEKIQIKTRSSANDVGRRGRVRRRRRRTLTLDTSKAADGGGDFKMMATVNCSLVESIHDAWMSLLEREFAPLETICRGSVDPCLDRLIAFSRQQAAASSSSSLSSLPSP